MTPERSNHFLAVAASGIFAYVILASGICFPQHKGGGITQVGRHASVVYEDGAVIDLSESETDLAVWKRRRFAGGVGHDFQQTFIMADGREMEVPYNQPDVAEDGQDLSTGDHLISATVTQDATDKASLDKHRGVDEVLNLRLDGSYQVASVNGEDEDRVYINVIDGKDGVAVTEIDGKDGKDIQVPAFAVDTEQTLEAQRAEMLWMGVGSSYGDYRIMLFGGNAMTSGLGGSVHGNGGSVSSPPIGAAIPEPSSLVLLAVAGGLGLTYRVRQRRNASV